MQQGVSYLKVKSEFNLDAAKKLYDFNLYAPSVHCSYYSVFQLMKHTLMSFCGIDYDNQEKELSLLKRKKATQSIGVHEYVINKIGNELKTYSNEEYLLFNRKIKDLKKFRRESDYQNIEIKQEEGKKALDYSNDLNVQLKRIFIK